MILVKLKLRSLYYSFVVWLENISGLGELRKRKFLKSVEGGKTPCKFRNVFTGKRLSEDCPICKGDKK